MINKLKNVVLGICYGACVMILLKGGVVKPQLFSQLLGASAAALAVYRQVTLMPDILFSIGFVVGGAVMYFIKF